MKYCSSKSSSTIWVGLLVLLVVLCGKVEGITTWSFATNFAEANPNGMVLILLLVIYLVIYLVI
jgi:hypothetical protein